MSAKRKDVAEANGVSEEKVMCLNCIAMERFIGSTGFCRWFKTNVYDDDFCTFWEKKKEVD